MVKKSKLIVFEGVDGTGKTTQVKLLLNYFRANKIVFSHYSFPRYEEPWGKMVKRYLDGEFGSVNQVNPYLASILYTADRLLAAEKINQELNDGKIVICDRYTASNIAHQAAKLQTPNSKHQFVKWVEDFEYNQNGIPKEDLVILLSVSVSKAQALMKSRKKDIHERNKKYLEKVAQVFENLAKSRKNWRKIDCVENNRLLTSQEIHKKVLEIIL